MTHAQLKENTRVRHASGYNCYHVEIKYQGQIWSCTSNNSLAWDCLEEKGYYTPKQALMAFRDECMQKNHIGKYEY